MKKIFYAVVGLALPFQALAADTSNCPVDKFDSISGIFQSLTCIMLRYVINFMITLATVLFVWGVIQYFINPENEEKRKAGKQFMIWGIIGLFVMVSIWGIVNIFTTTFGITKNTIPQVQVQ
jgi:hypothetical protein